MLLLLLFYGYVGILLLFLHKISAPNLSPLFLRFLRQNHFSRFQGFFVQIGSTKPILVFKFTVVWLKDGPLRLSPMIRGFLVVFERELSLLSRAPSRE